MIWSLPNGKRLVTVDESGYAKAWRANHKGQLQNKAAWEHTLQGGISDLLCRAQEGASSDLAKMAVAAVSGDDISFSRKSSATSGFDLSASTVENLGFYLGGKQGGIAFVDPKGTKTVRAEIQGQVRSLYYCPQRAILVIAMSDLGLHAYRSSPTGELQKLRQVKLSGSTISCSWVAPGVLVSATGDSSLKIWDLQRNEHNLIQAEGGTSVKINMVDTNSKTGTIAAAASDAGVIFWQSSKNRNGLLQFTQKSSSFSAPSQLISWFQKSTLSPLLATANADSVSLLREQKIQEVTSGGMTVMQIGPQQVLVLSNENEEFSYVYNVDVPVQSMAICSKSIPSLTIWSGRTILSYAIDSKQLSIKSTGINCSSPVHVINNQNIYSFSDDQERIQVHSIAGIEKQVMNLGMLGTELDTNGSYLVATCLPSTLRVFDLSRREAKQTVNRDISTLLPDVTFIHSSRINSSGNRVAFFGNDQAGNGDLRVYIYSPDRQKIQVHDTRHVISRMTTQSDDYSSQATSTSGLDTYGIQPVDVRWDERDPNLLSVLYKSENEDIIICYWVTENGLLEQEELSFPTEARSFLSLRAPYYIFSSNEGNNIIREPLRDFVGLESCDDSTRSALLDFSRQVIIDTNEVGTNSFSF